MGMTPHPIATNNIIDDTYGELYINTPSLLNKMVIEAHKGGKVVYENKCDKLLVELLTKRYNSNRKYSPKAMQIFKDLNLLSNIPTHRSSKKSKIGGLLMYYNNPES